MKLLASLTSPFARKVRIAFAEKKIDYELVVENPWSEDTQVPNFNPLGKVPVLVLDDGTTLFDSRVIVEYLDSISPVGRLLPVQGRQRVAVRRWEALADGALDAGTTVFRERQRSISKQDAAWIERHLGKVNAAVATISDELGDRDWCSGDKFSLADIAVGSALFWFELRLPEISWKTDHARLKRLTDKLATRPSFKDTVPVV